MSRLLLILVIASPSLAQAEIHRSRAVRAEFQRHHPCPANGHRHGPCPGYVIDHIWPLGCGGPDAPANMQWLTIAQDKAKDQWELNCGAGEVKR